MKNVYGRLAFLGIKNNRKLYVPYILTTVGTVMMFYVMCGLFFSESIVLMAGARTAATILALGIAVIGIFAVIFMFYSNSFLIKRREKELGLYNILGMNKKNITKILSVETGFIAVVSLVGGILTGTIFLALSKMLLAGLLGGSVGFEIEVPLSAVLMTVVVFAVIYVLILAFNAARVGVSKPISLVQSGKGEKPPKANFVFAILGLIILGYAYVQALTIDNPIQAVVTFFFAVIAVIVGTYILFMAGSVAIFRLLQRKKSYYYKPNHFVSVSTLVWRMRKNGAGLATICILCTMVLVMLSSAGSLYVGAEDSLARTYPHSLSMSIGFDSDRLDEGLVKETVDKVVDDCVAKSGYDAESGDPEKNIVITREMRDYTVLPDEEYDALVDPEPEVVSESEMQYLGGGHYKVYIVGLDPNEGSENYELLSQSFMETSDGIYMTLEPERWREDSSGYMVYYGDSEGDTYVPDPINYIIRSDRKGMREEFYGMYGGLFFLGIVLSVLFLGATVLIIYYKQISEGYEDRDRFSIMKKVGMTGREIKKTVNSQVLTVFFAPLLASGIHLLFAFPFIYKILMVLGANNKPLLITANVLCYLCFAALYMLVYKRTSRSYIKIVDAQTT